MTMLSERAPAVIVAPHQRRGDGTRVGRRPRAQSAGLNRLSSSPEEGEPCPHDTQNSASWNSQSNDRGFHSDRRRSFSCGAATRRGGDVCLRTPRGLPRASFPASGAFMRNRQLKRALRATYFILSCSLSLALVPAARAQTVTNVFQ